MRIISGTLKGKKLLLPKDKTTRPLKDIVKESIFNVIEHSNKMNVSIIQSNILDLYSGSGSFGIEALSRGAKKVTFVENYSMAHKILTSNISNLNCSENSDVIKDNCINFLDKIEDKQNLYDLIFLDPPFKDINFNSLIEKILKKKILKNEGVIIIHRHKRDNVKFTDNMNILDQRTYGISKITFGN